MLRGLEKKEIKCGDVVIIRYEGPTGGPGLPEMLTPTRYVFGIIPFVPPAPSVIIRCIESPFCFFVLPNLLSSVALAPQCHHGSGTWRLRCVAHGWAFQRRQSRVLHRPHYAGSTGGRTHRPREGASTWHVSIVLILDPVTISFTKTKKTNKERRSNPHRCPAGGSHHRPSDFGRGVGGTQEGLESPSPPGQQRHLVQIHPVRRHRKRGMRD